MNATMKKHSRGLRISAAIALALAGTMSMGNAQAARTDITVGMQLEPPNLDPTGAAAAAIDEVVYANVFEGLTRFGSDGSVNPALASAWTVSDDGKTYTFTLQQGVKFHDGADFTAEDVKFSLDRARSENSTNAQKQLFVNIDSVNVIDDHTVEIALLARDGNLLFNLAWGDAVMVDEASIDDAAIKPVGTGPFTFANWVQGDKIELAKNPNYWGAPANLDKVVFKFISDPTAAFAATMSGDVDTFPVFPAPENLAQFEADPRFNVLLGSTEGETILSINNQQAPLDDVRVRKAIAHAIDRSAIIDGAMFGYGTPIGSHFAPHNPAYIDLTANSQYDPALSKKLLSEAGLADGFSTTLKLPPPSYARRGGEIIAAQLREVGIDVEISNLEWAQWLEQVFRGKDYGLTIVSHTEPMDINIYAKPSYYFQYDNTTFQALMAAFNTQTDPARRTVMLQQAQKIISEDYVNGFLFQLAKTGVANAKIKGLWQNSPTQANDMTGVYWED